jgi:hypothetical protein
MEALSRLDQASLLPPKAGDSTDIVNSEILLVAAEEELAAETAADVLKSKQEENAAELRNALLQEKRKTAIQGDEGKQPTADAIKPHIAE